MRVLLIAAMLAVSASGQIQVISDTLTNAVGGGNYTGRITVTLNAPGSAQPLYWGAVTLTGFQITYCLAVPLPANDCTVNSAAGVLLASLYSNATIQPPGTSYNVRYVPLVGTGWTETWVVEVGNTKVREVRRTTVPSPTVLFNPSQIRQAGATTGQCLAWNGTSWAPAACGSGSGGNTWDDLLGTTWDDLT